MVPLVIILRLAFSHTRTLRRQLIVLLVKLLLLLLLFLLLLLLVILLFVVLSLIIVILIFRLVFLILLVILWWSVFLNRRLILLLLWKILVFYLWLILRILPWGNKLWLRRILGLIWRQILWIFLRVWILLFVGHLVVLSIIVDRIVWVRSFSKWGSSRWLLIWLLLLKGVTPLIRSNVGEYMFCSIDFFLMLLDSIKIMTLWLVGYGELSLIVVS